MKEVSNIRDLVNLWPTRAALASDVRAAFPGISISTHQVHKWAEKGTIPARYHLAIVEAAKGNGFQARVDAELIIRLHAPERGAA